MMTELDPSQSRLLGALTLTVVKHLGESALVVDEDDNLCSDWRMVRLDDVVLFEKPADKQSPKRIDCYHVVERSACGTAFRLDPARLVYSLKWKHNARPPDFELVPVQAEPQLWVNTANLTLLAALRRRAPHAIDWAGTQDVVLVLDAFEAALDSRAAHRH